MTTSELHEPLEQLRTEIKKLGDDDEAIKRRMKRLVGDLERQLDDSDDFDDEPQLLDGLRRNIERFEVEHPRLTGVLHELMRELSNMGI